MRPGGGQPGAAAKRHPGRDRRPAAGHITPQELSHIKLAFQSSLCSIGDSLARTEGWYLSGLLQGDPITPQQDMEEIASITAEEVAAAAAVLTLDTVFFFCRP